MPRDHMLQHIPQQPNTDNTPGYPTVEAEQAAAWVAGVVQSMDQEPFAIPAFTAAELAAKAAAADKPPAGALAFNSTASKLQEFDGAAWQDLGGAPGGAGLEWTAFDQSVDFAVVSTDFGSDTQVMDLPANATLLLVTSLTMEQIGGTYSDGLNNVNVSFYYDAGKTELAGFTPTLMPPFPATVRTDGQLNADGDDLHIEISDNTFAGETAQYRLRLVGSWI